MRHAAMIVVWGVVMAGLWQAIDPQRPVFAQAPAEKPAALTEVQTLKVKLSISEEQGARQQIALLQVQLSQILAARDALVKDIEGTYPGWTVSLDRAGQVVLIPVPKPAPEKK